MTLPEAIALGPAWVGYWLNWMMIGGFILPLALLIWKETRIAALLTVGAGVLSAVGVGWLYEQFGYVKLLGIPHILFWTPLALYLWVLGRSDHVRVWPRRIIWVVLATILISLLFDYTDFIRYILGERTPLAMPAS